MSVHLANESDLVAAAQTGDQDAFGILVNSYSRAVFHLAMGITRNREDAEDVVQDAMLKAYCNLHRFQGNSRFYTWVVRIAINEALMKLRKRQHSAKAVALDDLSPERGAIHRELEDWTNYPERSYAQKELRGILDAAMRELSPRLAAAFRLFGEQELCFKETADKLGLSVYGAKSRVSRARARLRKRLRSLLRGRAKLQHALPISGPLAGY